MVVCLRKLLDMLMPSNSDLALTMAFVNPPHADWSLANNITYLMCQSHYQRNGKYADKVRWLPAPYQFNRYQTYQEIYNEIADADVVMFSSYAWNYSMCDEIAKIAKFHGKTTVLGGPHIGTNDPALLTTRTFYDYICQPTKPGEVFIEDFIDSYFENKKRPLKSDISWEINSEKKRTYLLNHDYSIYEDHRAYLREALTYAKSNQIEPFIVVETTRGCPYSCVFCEWGGGIETKILKKDIEIVKRDIDAMLECGFSSAYLTDANFGVFFDRDLEIFKYAWARGFNLTDISTMKSKDLAKRKRLIDAWFETVGGNVSLASSSIVPTVSIQSISDQAMKIAKRVDLCFKDKIELSKHIRSKCEQYDYPTPALELILAMPGSTLSDFYNEMEIVWNFKAWGSYRHDYMFLPDSTLNSTRYKEQYQIKTVEVYSDTVDEDGIDNINSLYKNRISYFKTILSCFSFNEDEMREMWFMNNASNFLLENFYAELESYVSPGEFCKLCYNEIIQLEDFKAIDIEIRDIFDPATAPRSIRQLGNRFRVDVIEEFLEKNKLLFMSGVIAKCLN
jgi:hypothetical protein